jgi:N-hydroxyarylamine O-acetyltransferase
VFDLDRYLERIGLRGRPTLAEVHRAHVISIPFENLDPYRGVPVSLALEDLARKLVDERRGGYCFEHNVLLKAALEALGMEVELYLAAGGGPAPEPPRPAGRRRRRELARRRRFRDRHAARADPVRAGDLARAGRVDLPRRAGR